MKAKVSTKGQVVIPNEIRKRFGIQPGDEMLFNRSDEQIVMVKVSVAGGRPTLVRAKGKMPLVKMPRGAKPLTPEMVKEMAQL